MNRRSIFGFLGLAPIAVPTVLAAPPLRVCASALIGRTVAAEGQIEAQATAIQSFTTRVGGHEGRLTSFNPARITSVTGEGEIDGQRCTYRFGHDGLSYRFEVLPDVVA